MPGLKDLVGDSGGGGQGREAPAFLGTACSLFLVLEKGPGTVSSGTYTEKNVPFLPAMELANVLYAC